MRRCARLATAGDDAGWRARWARVCRRPALPMGVAFLGMHRNAPPGSHAKIQQ